MLNFVLCDDNINILNKMKQMLETIFIKNNFNASVSFQSTNYLEILNYINNNTVDVIMLDINLQSNKSGLELAKEIRKICKNAYLIFTTGHLEYAMVAYKYKTFDYLAKPITYDRLEDTITRLFEDVNNTSKNYIRIDNKNTFIDSDEIHYIKKDKVMLVFHTSIRDYTTYGSFSKFENRLPKTFIRCHKSYIANISQIKDIDPISSIVTFKDNSTCYLGPKYKENFMEVLNAYGNF